MPTKHTITSSILFHVKSAHFERSDPDTGIRNLIKYLHRGNAAKDDQAWGGTACAPFGSDEPSSLASPVSSFSFCSVNPGPFPRLFARSRE
jgi:hypothetical protein